MTEVKVSFDDTASLWDGTPAGEAGHIDSSLDELAARLNLVVLVEDDAKFLLLSDDSVGVVSLFWEPEAPTEEMSAIVTRADVDRPAFLLFMRRVFGSELSIVIYPDECEIA